MKRQIYLLVILYREKKERSHSYSMAVAGSVLVLFIFDFFFVLIFFFNLKKKNITVKKVHFRLQSTAAIPSNSNPVLAQQIFPNKMGFYLH